MDDHSPTAKTKGTIWIVHVSVQLPVFEIPVRIEGIWIGINFRVMKDSPATQLNTSI